MSKNLGQVTYFDFKKGFVLRNEPQPIPAQGEALIRIVYSGLCGTDLHVMYGAAKVKRYNKQKIIIGHAWSGKVVGLGAGVRGLRIGERVYGGDFLPCGKCAECSAGRENLCDKRLIPGMEMPGTHRAFVALPARLVRPVPRGVDMRSACFLADVLAVVDHAIRRAPPHPTDRVGVYGAGPLGLVAGLLLRKVYGVRTLYLAEPSAYRRRLAAKLFHPITLPIKKEAAYKNFFDVVYEIAGSDKAIDSALHLIRRGGDLVIVGVHDQPAVLPSFKMVTRYLRISGSLTYRLKELEHIGRLAKKIGLGSIITHTMPMKDIARAYRLFAQKKTGAVLLVP